MVELFVLLSVLHAIYAEKEVRIDWVGEPGHAQPQDPPSTVQPNGLGTVYETRQALHYVPVNNADTNDDTDDLQQQVEPIFGKGTYLEFDEQRKLKP